MCTTLIQSDMVPRLQNYDGYCEVVQKGSGVQQFSNSSAQNCLDDFHKNGEGLADEANTMKWCRKVAEQGTCNVGAQNSLRLCYYYGKGF